MVGGVRMIEIPIILSEDGSMSEEALRNAISLVKTIGESPENCIFVPSEPELAGNTGRGERGS